MTNGKYAIVLGKYFNSLEKRGRLSTKFFNKLLDWYSVQEQRCNYGDVPK